MMQACDVTGIKILFGRHPVIALIPFNSVKLFMGDKHRVETKGYEICEIITSLGCQNLLTFLDVKTLGHILREFYVSRVVIDTQ